MAITLDGSAGISGATTGTFSGNVTANGLSTELRPLVLDTAKASTSGTTVDFTGIPSWVKRVTVMFSGVSTSGTSLVQLQVGSGSFLTSGYLGGYGNNAANGAHSAGFILQGNNLAADLRTGIVTLINLTGNTWSEAGCMGVNGASVPYTSQGVVTLSGTLDRIRITTVNGTDTFDAGTINIMYE